MVEKRREVEGIGKTKGGIKREWRGRGWDWMVRKGETKVRGDKK